MNRNTRKDIQIPLDQLMGSLENPFNAQLPDISAVNLYRMANERKIWFDLAVDATTLEWERMIMLWNMEDRGKPVEERKPIFIYMFNYGGSFDFDWSFIDMIDMSLTPVYTVNMGVCASAAADIFIAGKKRFMTRNARLMIHQGGSGFEGDASKVFDNVEDYKRQLKKIESFIVGRTHISSRLYKTHEKDDWWLDASECLKHGVCDKIVESIEDIL